MNNTPTPTEWHHKPGIYEICIKGHLDDRWTAWFEGLTIVLEENGNTLLTGPVIDQAALHGFIKKVRNLNMPLLSVNRINHIQTHFNETVR